MILTSKQKEFHEIVMSGRNVYLTGKAGTGKSFIIREVMAAFDEMKIKYVAVAPTGIAANNIEGQTIHSLFALTPFGVLDYEKTNFVNKGKREVLKAAKVIIIDEVSMMRPDVLDAMHFTLRKNGLDGLDKRQIIFVGDLKQLPPIIDDNMRSVLLQTYDGVHFFDALIYKRLNVHEIELSEVMRQSDPEFINALNVVRDGGKDQYFRKFVHTEAKGIVLAPHNSTVQSYNLAGLNAINGETFTFTAKVKGTVKPEDFNLENEIKVKNGCKIMYLINSRENPLRNGSLGVFSSHKGCHFIRHENTDFSIEPVEVFKKEYVYNKSLDKLELIEKGSIIQMPIKLAYALSIHKSQGLTFDEITLDLRLPCFAKGQLYVGLSRVRTPEGLRIIH